MNPTLTGGNANLAQPGCPRLRERDHNLEAMKAVVIRLAHDFNNYLAPMLGWTSLIKEEAAPDSMVMDYANKAESSARLAEGILDNILLSVRPERRFHPLETDLAQIVRQELEAWQSNLPLSVNLNVTAHIEACTLVLDADHWQRAVRHLLGNARYALALGGNLEVSLRPEKLTAQRAAELGIRGEETFCLCVKDDGLGMTPAVLERACEPFFSTRPKTQAPGLGLTMVHSITRLHGGQIILESAEDHGTTATLWLPHQFVTASPGPMARPAAHQTPPVSTLNAGGKVLIVDDDPMVIEVLRTFLRKAQHEVLTANDGKAGLDLFKRRGKEIKLVVSDMRMPVMNGVEFIREVRKLNAAMPVMFLTGEKDEVLNELLPKLGGNVPPLLKKPCTLREFLGTVSSLIG